MRQYIIPLCFFLGLAVTAISLVAMVAVANSLNQAWNFGQVSSLSIALGALVGCGASAIFRASRRSKLRPHVYDVSIDEAANAIRDAIVGPMRAVGNITDWEEDEFSKTASPDASGTQILSFSAVVEDYDDEFRRYDRIGGITKISRRITLSVGLNDLGGRTKVEIYSDALLGLSQEMYDLVFDDARSILTQALERA